MRELQFLPQEELVLSSFLVFPKLDPVSVQIKSLMSVGYQRLGPVVEKQAFCVQHNCLKHRFETRCLYQNSRATTKESSLVGLSASLVRSDPCQYAPSFLRSFFRSIPFFSRFQDRLRNLDKKASRPERTMKKFCQT